MKCLCTVVSLHREYKSVTDLKSHQRDNKGQLQACSLVRETVQVSNRLVVSSERQALVSYRLGGSLIRKTSTGQLQDGSIFRETSIRVSYRLVISSERQYRSDTGWWSLQGDCIGQQKTVSSKAGSQIRVTK